MTTEQLDLSGAVALVTGGNSGIGRAIALTYARAGAAVAIAGRNLEKNAAVLAELQAIGKPAVALELDVSDRSQLEPALGRVERELGPLSILVNNAGSGTLGGVLTLEVDEWDRVLETNLTAAFLLTDCMVYAFRRHMPMNGYGTKQMPPRVAICFYWAFSNWRSLSSGYYSCDNCQLLTCC